MPRHPINVHQQTQKEIQAKYLVADSTLEWQYEGWPHQVLKALQACPL